MRIALVAGATGLVGGHVLKLLLESTVYGQVIVLVRKPMTDHPKVRQILFDGGDTTMLPDVRAHDVYCCLGTTMAKAKSKEQFRAVDYDYVVTLARKTKLTGTEKFLLISALGAKKDSSIFYNQVKGEVEAAVSAIGFRVLHIFRPSLLLGHRDEKRSGEDAAKLVYKIFGFLIPARYKGIEAIRVARAMLAFASEDKSGIFIHESEALQQF